MTSVRPLALLSLIVALFAASVPRSADGDILDRPPNQVMIEAMLVSIELHREVQFGIDFLHPRDSLDTALAGEVRSRVIDAQASTADAIGEIQADAGFASSSAGLASLGLLNGTLWLQDQMLDALDQDAKVKELSRSNLLAIGNQVAAIETTKEHPIVPGTLDGELSKKELKAVGQFYYSAHHFQGALLDYGITMDPLLGFFEGFDGGKKRDILTRFELQVLENLKATVKKGDLILQGTERQPSNASAVVSMNLPDQFTILSRGQLSEKLSDKKPQALENFSFGIEVASDLGSPPAQFAGYELQTTPEGIAQGFTFANGVVLDVFPVAMPRISTRTVATNIVVKDADTLVISGILKFENGEEVEQTSQIPMLGNLPVLRYIFRHMSRENAVRKRELLIFVSPTVITPQ